MSQSTQCGSVVADLESGKNPSRCARFIAVAAKANGDRWPGCGRTAGLRGRLESNQFFQTNVSSYLPLPILLDSAWQVLDGAGSAGGRHMLEFH